MSIEKQNAGREKPAEAPELNEEALDGVNGGAFIPFSGPGAGKPKPASKKGGPQAVTLEAHSMEPPAAFNLDNPGGTGGNIELL